MKRILTPTLLLILPAQIALAGVVFEVETTDHDSPQAGATTEVAIEGKNLKMNIRDRGSRDGDAIFRGDRREMVVVDHDQKSYMVIDEAAIRQIGGQVSQAMKQMEEALKNVPEGQREMVEKMLKERGGMAGAMGAAKLPPIEHRRTGERAEKNGYPCVKLDVLRGGKKIRELWVTDWDNIEGGDEAIDAFEGMAAFFQEMMEGIGASGGPFGDGFDNPFASMKEIDGFPVVTREFDDDGDLESESTLRSSRRRTLDPADFEPPAGYKRRQMFPGGS